MLTIDFTNQRSEFVYDSYDDYAGRYIFVLRFYIIIYEQLLDILLRVALKILTYLPTHLLITHVSFHFTELNGTIRNRMLCKYLLRVQTQNWIFFLGTFANIAVT